MSYKKLRSENNCLNCGHVVEKRFCSACGQENLEFNESSFHLVIHYFKDLVHYDGKFFHTIKHFIRKPGLVPSDYMIGKRKKHINPIQFYLFASTIFFLFLFFFADPAKNITIETGEDHNEVISPSKKEKEILKPASDTTYVDSLMSKLKSFVIDTVTKSPDSITNDDFEFGLFGSKWKADNQRSWLGKILGERVKKKTKEMNTLHKGDEKTAIKAFLSELFHSLPQLIFLSLPFFALFLLLLYFRSPQNSYVSNFIFSIYHYSYLYILFLFYLMISGVKKIVTWAPADAAWGWVIASFIIYSFVYLFLSMRRFYNDKGTSLMLKYIALLFLFISTLIFLFVAITVFTFIF